MISTIRDWVASILGEYAPITYEFKELSSVVDGYEVWNTYDVIPQGLAGVDWEYVVTACLLLVVIYSVFRLLGVLLQAFTGGGRY